MKLISFNKDIVFDNDKVQTKLILESEFSKEIRVVMKSGQQMKAHKTPFPIVVHLLEGEIDFGIEGEVFNLRKGAIITLEGGVTHDLSAKADSVVRLTLSKSDSEARVSKVAKG